MGEWLWREYVVEYKIKGDDREVEKLFRIGLEIRVFFGLKLFLFG